MTRVVFLHGFLGSPDAWDPIREELASHGAGDRDVVTPWLPGHGPSARPLAATSFAAGVDAVIESAGAAPALWVGYSMGGRIALGVAERAPSLVRGLVLISAHLGLASDAERARRASEDDAFARLADDGIAAMVDAHASRSVLIAQNALPTCLRAMLRERRLGHDAAAIASSIRALGLGAMPDLRAALRSIDAPVVTVAGGDDATYAALAREAAELGRGEAVILPSCGHDVVIEDPEPVAAAVLRAALRIEDGTCRPTRGTESHP